MKNAGDKLTLHGPRRVQILTNSAGSYHKKGQFAYVISEDDRGALAKCDQEYALSAPGETVYLVTKAKHGHGGAGWFSASGIRFTTRGKPVRTAVKR